MVPEGFASGVPAALTVHQFQHRSGATGPQPLFSAGSGDGGLNDDGIWLVSFMHYDLGYIDLEQKTLQTLDNPFGPRLSPM